MPKANKPKVGQQTKTSAKGAHGGGVKFSQVSFGPGFKNIAGKGVNAGKKAAKLSKAKSNLSEARPRVAFGKGFVASVSESALRVVSSKTKGVPAVRAKRGGKR